jgi:hypothetical protein
VDLKEIAGGPEIVDAAINYLYTAQYISGHSPLLHHVQMCIFADRHNIADLVTRSEEEFSQQVQSVLDGGHAFDRFDYSNAVKLIYTSFPAHGALHTRAEDLAVAKAEILFSGTDEAVEFQEQIKSNTQFLINVCRRSAVSKKSQGDTSSSVDFPGPTSDVNVQFGWGGQPSSRRRPQRPRPGWDA